MEHHLSDAGRDDCELGLGLLLDMTASQQMAIGVTLDTKDLGPKWLINESQLTEACIPVISKLILGCTTTEPPKLHIHHLVPAGHNSLVGNSSCCRVIHLDRSFRLLPTHGNEGLAVGNILRAVMKTAASSDSAAEAMTNLIVWAIVRMARLNRGNGPFSKR
jgi:hypothetical protein